MPNYVGHYIYIYIEIFHLNVSQRLAIDNIFTNILTGLMIFKMLIAETVMIIIIICQSSRPVRLPFLQLAKNDDKPTVIIINESKITEQELLQQESDDESEFFLPNNQIGYIVNVY